MAISGRRIAALSRRELSTQNLRLSIGRSRPGLAGNTDTSQRRAAEGQPAPVINKQTEANDRPTYGRSAVQPRCSQLWTSWANQCPDIYFVPNHPQPELIWVAPAVAVPGDAVRPSCPGRPDR